MTTQGVTKAKTASAQTKEANAPAAPGAGESAAKPINRREFLFYIWGASIAVLLAQSGGAIVWFLLPRFRAGEFGGVFQIDPATLPGPEAPPLANPTGKYWLTHTEEGVQALSMVCTHLGCLFKWSDTNNRFECPCHGSKFTKSGIYIEGPAPRNLDRFATTVVTSSGEQTNPQGEPTDVANAIRFDVNTGRKIKGDSHG